jgi:predicted DNA-binding transcriptional regulator YafY
MDRRLLILMRLRAERPVRAQDLADECECSVRTIYRDIEALCEAGVPVAAQAGEGYRLVAGYHLPPIAFSAEEAVQLLMGADVALGLGTATQRESTRAAMAKVEAALRPETLEEVRRLRERIKVSTWNRRELSPWLPLLLQAVVNDQVVALRYHSYSPDQVTERKVEPYSLVHYGQDWHLVAYCRLREGMRDFRTSRIRAAVLLGEHFKRQTGIDTEVDHEPRASYELRVWLDESAVPWAREDPAFGFEREEPGDGGAVFVFTVWEMRRLMPWLLGWGAAAKVLSPPEAADEVRREAEALAARYAE